MAKLLVAPIRPAEAGVDGGDRLPCKLGLGFSPRRRSKAEGKMAEEVEADEGDVVMYLPGRKQQAGCGIDGVHGAATQLLSLAGKTGSFAKAPPHKFFLNF